MHQFLRHLNKATLIYILQAQTKSKDFCKYLHNDFQRFIHVQRFSDFQRFTLIWIFHLPFISLPTKVDVLFSLQKSLCPEYVENQWSKITAWLLEVEMGVVWGVASLSIISFIFASIWYIDPALLTMVLQFQAADCKTVHR